VYLTPLGSNIGAGSLEGCGNDSLGIPSPFRASICLVYVVTLHQRGDQIGPMPPFVGTLQNQFGAKWMLISYNID
jgi:hypothetical protein